MGVAGATPEERALRWLIEEDPLQLSTSSSSDQFRLTQRYALLTLWFQSGRSWNNETGWLSALDECTWGHIICATVNGQQVVSELDFNTNDNLVSLPEDMGLLTGVTILNLPRTILSNGQLPESIGSMSNLEEFQAHASELTGTLPDSIGLWSNP